MHASKYQKKEEVYVAVQQTNTAAIQRLLNGHFFTTYHYITSEACKIFEATFERSLQVEKVAACHEL